MAITSTIHKVIERIKNASGDYETVYRKTLGELVEFKDGKTAESKVGGIDGIANNLVSTNSRLALSASQGKNLQDQVNAHLADNTKHRVVQYLYATSNVLDETTSDTFVNSSLSLSVKPLYGDSIIIVQVSGGGRTFNSSGGGTPHRWSEFQIYNATEGVIAQSELGSQSAHFGTDVAYTRYNIGLLGSCQAGNTSLRTFTLRFRSANTLLTTQIRGDVFGVSMTIMEVRP